MVKLKNKTSKIEKFKAKAVNYLLKKTKFMILNRQLPISSFVLNSTSTLTSILIMICLLFSGSIFADRVVVSSVVKGSPIAGQPIEGAVTINHLKEQKIDTKSFRLGNDPLEVNFIEEVVISPGAPEVFTAYNFLLDPQTEGLHQLPPISVTVGGEVYRSFASTYQVFKEGSGAVPRPQQQPQQSLKQNSARSEQLDSKDSGKQESVQKNVEVVLRLETIVDHSLTSKVSPTNLILYPGQTIRVGYRYFYIYSVELSKEVIPLLQDERLVRIGGKDYKEFTRDGQNIVEITQLVSLDKPGEYQFPGGYIEGRAYRMDRYGKKEYAKIVSQASSDPVTITLKAFPEEGKPSNFEGAIAEGLAISAQLITPSEVMVGDKVIVEITVSASGDFTDFNTITVPKMCCRSGIDDLFRQGGLPPTEEVTTAGKIYRLEVRPLSESVTEIPTFKLSYFNPKTEKYEEAVTQSLPMTVKALVPEVKTVVSGPGFQTVTKQSTGEIEIQGNFPIRITDLKNLDFGTWVVLWVLPMGLFALYVEYLMRERLRLKELELKVIESEALFEKAMKDYKEGNEFFQMLRKAFMQRLIERGEIDQKSELSEGVIDINSEGLSYSGVLVNPEDLPNVDVRVLFSRMDKMSYSGDNKNKTPDDVAELVSDAKKLFKQLQEEQMIQLKNSDGGGSNE